jgi:tripartite-type tricarboxylate transporter receptor subunit TctC
MRHATVIAGCFAALMMTTKVSADGFPSKPVRLVVGFTPGSATDVIARTVSQKLSELWGQQVIVENRSGAGGSIAAATVAKSAPEGYTLLVHTNAYAANPALYSNLPYDPRKDLAAVASLVSQPFVLVAGKSFGASTVSELIAAAKAKPGELNYGSAGIGSGTHFTAEKFRLAAGIEATHIPAKGGPEANADVISGRVAYWFPPVAAALPHLREGRVRALGVTTARRSTLLPDVPTIAEASLAGFDSTFWVGLWAPSGTSGDVLEQISAAVARALAVEDLRERLAKLGAEPMIMTRARFARFVEEELQEAARLVKAAGIPSQ